MPAATLPSSPARHSTASPRRRRPLWDRPAALFAALFAALACLAASTLAAPDPQPQPLTAASAPASAAAAAAAPLPPPPPPPQPPSESTYGTGYAQHSRGSDDGDGVTATPADSACVRAEHDLQPLFVKSLFPDVDFWKLKAPFGFTAGDLSKLIADVKEHNREDQVVLIRRGRWFYPLHPLDASVHFTPGHHPDFTTAGEPDRAVSPWLASAQYYFTTHAREWGCDFPDALFHLDVGDRNFCALIPGGCKAPSFALWKQKGPGVDPVVNSDILLPLFFGANHSLYDYPWARKAEKPFFRGRGGEAGLHENDRAVEFNGTQYYPREHLAALSAASPELLDFGFVDGLGPTRGHLQCPLATMQNTSSSSLPTA